MNVQGGHPQSGLLVISNSTRGEGMSIVEPVGQDKKTMSNHHVIRHLLLHSLLLPHAHMIPGSQVNTIK